MKTKQAQRFGLAWSLAGLLLASTTVLAQHFPNLYLPDAPSSPANRPWGLSQDFLSKLSVLFIGMILGICGHMIRHFANRRKNSRQNRANATANPTGRTAQNSPPRGGFLFCLLIGAAAGAFAAEIFSGIPAGGSFFLCCVAAGYAGSYLGEAVLLRSQPAPAGQSAGEPTSAGNYPETNKRPGKEAGSP